MENHFWTFCATVVAVGRITTLAIRPKINVEQTTSYVARLKLDGASGCTKLDDVTTEHISSCNRMSANVYNFTRILQNSEPDKINNLAKFILCGLKLYGQ